MLRWTILVVIFALPDVHGQRVVDTQHGQVRGHIVNVNNGKTQTTVDVFYDVRYGNDTSGALRFASPVHPDPWTEIYEADTLGAACPQDKGGILAITHPLWRKFSEDCLNVNIYTPTDQTGGPYPVMLWLFGGAFQAGANFQYPGHFLASREIVVVTANYRVGKFGFAYTANDACPGNAGLWDQKMALDFVINNIANFGGDPLRITVFGQSAGAASTGHMVVSPHTKDLFQQAMYESGTEFSFWAVNWPESSPENYVHQVAQELECVGADDYQTIDCLRGLPWQIVHNASFSCTPGHFCLGMAPVVDGPGGYLPEKPQDLRLAGDIMTGPIIAGINKDDGSLYTMAIIPESLFGGFNRSEYEYYLTERLLAFWEDVLDNETAADAVHAVDWNYAPWPYIHDEYANRESFNQMITDAAYGAAWDELIKLHETEGPTYAYVYNYRGRNSTQIFPEWIGVPHMGELPYVWGYPLLQLNPEIRNDSRIHFDIIDWTSDEDIAHTIFFQDLIENFVKYGNPTPTPVSDPLGGSISWPEFSFEDMNTIYISNTSIHIEKEWEQQDYAFWKEYMAFITAGAPVPITSEDFGEGNPSNKYTEYLVEYLDIMVDIRLTELDYDIHE